MRKRSESTIDNDARIEAALEDLRDGVVKTVRAAAKAHGVAESTLRARHHGGKSRAQVNEQKQFLSEREENALVQWIHEVSADGYPPRKSRVREMAEEIRLQRVFKITDASICHGSELSPTLPHS